MIWALFRLAFLLAFLIRWNLPEGGLGAPLTGWAGGVVIAAAAYCLVVMVMYARYERLPGLRPATVVIDLLFVTACLGVPEASVSFFPIYFLLIVMAAMEWGLWGGVAVAGFASLLYCGYQYAHPFAPATGIDALFVAVTMRVPWLGLVALATGLLARAQERALRIEQEMRTARRLQEMLLPTRLPEMPGYVVGSAFEPARDVGGDYFDVLRVSPDDVGLCIADVSGRSVPAALHISLLKHQIHASAERFPQPGEMATHLNGLLYPHFRSLGSELFVGLFYGIVHLPSGRISYVNCGHVPPLLCTPLGETRELHTGGIVLGVSETPSYEEQTAVLEPGDLLVLCTDGVLGRRNPRKEEFSAEQIARIVRGRPPASAQDTADQVMAAAEQFGGRGREDDATILIAARLPAADGA
ncbi:MAG: PP2C family protein-serine/threonine phosphatase [Armatimonadota bacterium]